MVHEMAHAATNQDHGRIWRRELERLRSRGAPTDPLDFVRPYSIKEIIADFIDAGQSGASWQEALDELAGYYHRTLKVDLYGTPWDARTARILKQVKHYFVLATRQYRPLTL
jgi:hypothetical protein